MTSSHTDNSSCPACHCRIGQSQGNYRCANCGWLGSRIATTEAVASVTRIPAPDVADKGAASTHLRDLDQPLLHGMDSNAALTRDRPGVGSSPAGCGSELLTDEPSGTPDDRARLERDLLTKVRP